MSRVPLRLALAAALLGPFVGGCEALPEGPEVVRLRADANRKGDSGDEGPHGVGCAHLRRNVRLHDAAELDLCWPLDADDAVAEGALPTAVLLPGGAVEPMRYAWLQTHLVSRGYVVVLPRFALDLAILDAEPAEAALDLLDALDVEGLLSGRLLRDNGTAVLGHSLGGVIAAERFAADARIGALVLLASYPADATDAAARPGDPVLVLSGKNDGAATPKDVIDGFERYGTPRWLGLVEGMTHYAWTDGATDAERISDGVDARPVVALRRDAMRLLDAFLDAQIAADPQGWARLSAGVFPGVELRQ